MTVSEPDWHPEAQKELDAAVAYYEEARPGQGDDFDAMVWEAVRQVERRLIYSLRGDAIRIEAVAHASREPGYWRERVEPHER